MPKLSSIIRSRSGSRNGVALLAVLAFVLLLTILVVSYISFTTLNRVSTVSYANSVQAQEIAKGGLQDIITDFQQEMIAGSINPANATFTQGTAPNITTIYVPSTNATAVPARLGYPAASWTGGAAAAATTPVVVPTKLLSTLVRVSRAAATGAPTAITMNPALSIANYTNLYSASNPNGGVVINRASPVSTGQASVNGRYISPARWNKPYLLSAATALIPTPFYKSTTIIPETVYPTTPDLPDWVYVTRTGSRVCNVATDTIAALKPSTTLNATYTAAAKGSNPTASPVIGRYAYVVYDEGALLDANVAGYTGASTNLVSTPIDPTTGMTQSINGKSFLSSADLTQIPGFYTGLPSTSQPKVDALIKFRNASSTGSGNSYLLSVIAYAKAAFTSFQTGDSPFVSRQDLINYFAKVDANFNTTTYSISQALPYLGTFSRAVSAPSYAPPADSSKIANYKAPSTPTPGQPTPPILYKTNAETSVANRDLANVRFGAASTAVTHYKDDATSGTYGVKVGDPLLRTRFSLAKINWLAQPWSGQTDPGTTASGYAASTYPTAIQSCFGLVWGSPGSTTTNGTSTSVIANGGKPCWNYVGSPAGTGTTAATFNGTIETLDQVALEGREPNFFELLKAAILSGSLGLNAGLAAFNNGQNNAANGRNISYDLRTPTVPTDLLGGPISSVTLSVPLPP